MNTMSTMELAYLAGLIDGEGCLSITPSKVQGKPIVYSVLLSISNTNRELLDWVQSTTGLGKISLGTKSKVSIEQNPQWEPVYLWRIFANGMRELIPVVYPYLIDKRQKAQLVTEFFALTKGRGYGSHLSEEEKYIRDQILFELKELNRRGRDASI